MDQRDEEDFHSNRGSRWEKGEYWDIYLTGEANIGWNIVKDGPVGPEFTWSKFLEEIRAKFYPIIV